MVEPSRASAEDLGEEALVDDALARIGADRDEIPEVVVHRLTERARIPDQRLVVGRYLITGELGRGGMGVVYEAWDPGIERRVAIKTIEPERVPEDERDEVIERFRRETKIVGRLHHPSIVTIYDSGNERAVDEATGQRVPVLYYYVMEYLEGQSLARVLRERTLLTEVEALRISLDIAEALQLSHEAGIIHRDIKPSNIFLREPMQAVLLDFGIAKSGSIAITRQGQILGTPSYLAPERLREKEVAIDGRADIFSLGVLLFTMLTGEAPFVGDDVYEVIDKITKEKHPRIDQHSRHGAMLSQMLDRMLAKDPRDRYGSAAEAALALSEVLRLVDGERPTSIVSEASIPELDTADVVSLDEATPHEDEEIDTGRLEMGRKPASEQDTSPKAPISGPAPVPSIPAASVSPSVRAALSRPASVAPIGRVPPPPMPTATDYRVRPTADLDEEDGIKKTMVSRPPDEAIEGDSLEGSEPLDASSFDGGDEQTAEELPAQKRRAEQRETLVEADPPARERPVKVADVLGTRPELALQRETRELARKRSEEPPMELTSPSIPPYFTEGAHGAASSDRAPSQDLYREHSSESDETTDDETIAEPSSAAGAVARSGPNKAAPRAFSDERSTEQLPRAAGGEPSVRGVSEQRAGALRGSSRARRSRIEASLVDEDDVVVKPAPLEALKPDELPTQAGYQRPAPAAAAAEVVPAATSTPDVVRARGDSRVQDPAEAQRDERTQGGAMVPDGDDKKSAAVARKTFGTPRGGGAAANIQVRVTGRGLSGASDDRMRMIRRRAVMLLAGALASVAIGLMVGRMQRRGPDADVEPPPSPQVEPRALQVRTIPGTNQLDLVRPRPPGELIADAEAARTSGQLDDAARLFERAIEATKEDAGLRAKAMLGLADVQRAKGDHGAAIKLYRNILRSFPKTDEAAQAQVALVELGVPLPAPRPPTEAKAPPSAPPPPPAAKSVQPPAPPPPPVMFKADDEMTGEEKCKVLLRRHLQSPEDAVKAFEAMRLSEPNEPCVYWNLGRKYEQLEKHFFALEAYRKYIRLAPNAPQRDTIEKMKIPNLEAKLRQK